MDRLHPGIPGMDCLSEAGQSCGAHGGDVVSPPSSRGLCLTRLVAVGSVYAAGLLSTAV